MKNAKKIVGRFFTTIKAQEMFHSFKDKNEKLNFKPDSMFDLQKIKSLPEVIAFLSLIASKKEIIIISKIAFQVTNALTKLINHNGLHNVNKNAAIFGFNNIKKMKHKPHSSISNAFSKIFGLINWEINFWSKNFVWCQWIIVKIKNTYSYL